MHFGVTGGRGGGMPTAFRLLYPQKIRFVIPKDTHGVGGMRNLQIKVVHFHWKIKQFFS